MKVIKEVPAPVSCDCFAKIMDLLEQRRRARRGDLGIGSVIECDCGKRRRLTDDLLSGPGWRLIR